jgi:ubiquinol-cytochrome c reductase cytochrome b subunit
MRFFKVSQILTHINELLVDYKCPKNLSYFWNFGILAATCLVIQLISGIALGMHYCANIDLAFISVEHIMRDVNYGWALRYCHANGASMFFIVVYIHMFRGLYYCSYLYPRQRVWNIGVIIFFLMIMTAFIGYVLPWGQMSFWGATVITNLCSAIPIIGNNIVSWLWGGFSVDNATLNRFYSLHYLLPFLITGLVLLHLIILHESGSGEPINANIIEFHKIVFHRYFSIKDYLGILFFLLFYIYFVFFNPNLLGHPDNYIPANPLKTPPHIVPEWYFLPFYAILRAIPDKLLGVIFMIYAILIFLVLPYIGGYSIKNASFRPFYRFSLWCFFFVCLTLGWLGSMPIEDPYVLLSRVCTFFYFLFFHAIVPMCNVI